MKYLKIEDEIKYYKIRYELERTVEDMFLKKGYTHIQLPIFEEIQNSMEVNRRIRQEFMVKVLSGFSEVLALRYDNTTSIIQNIIPRWEDDMKLKLFYNSTVFRNDPRSGISDIKQLGIEYLGESDLKGDIEIILLALDILEKFNSNFILEISSSKYIRGLFKEMNIDQTREGQIKDLIYRKNKFELVDYLQGLNLSKEMEDCLLNIFNLQGDIEKIVKEAKNYYTNTCMDEALDELMVIKDYITSNGYAQKVYLDLSMITELDYYDGIIFKGYYPNFFKEIIGGGRYDDFTVDFGKKVPALGFSLDLNALTNISYRKGNKLNGLY